MATEQKKMINNQNTARANIMTPNEFWLTYSAIIIAVGSGAALAASLASKINVWESFRPDVLDESGDENPCSAAMTQDECSATDDRCAWFGDIFRCGAPSWCETVQPRALVRTPSNTLSALLYIMVAVYIIMCASVDRRRQSTMHALPPLAQNPICLVWGTSLAAGCANLAHGAGVFFNHG